MEGGSVARGKMKSKDSCFMGIHQNRFIASVLIITIVKLIYEIFTLWKHRLLYGRNPNITQNPKRPDIFTENKIKMFKTHLISWPEQLDWKCKHWLESLVVVWFLFVCFCGTLKSLSFGKWKQFSGGGESTFIPIDSFLFMFNKIHSLPRLRRDVLLSSGGAHL